MCHARNCRKALKFLLIYRMYDMSGSMIGGAFNQFKSRREVSLWGRGSNVIEGIFRGVSQTRGGGGFTRKKILQI